MKNVKNNELNVPVVSIITPVHNLEALIPLTVESVLAQTFYEWEHILVDDCSSDQSWRVLQDMEALDRRISIRRLSKNVGAAGARNTAIDMAQGRYIAFLDGDDLWEPTKLKKQVEFMQETNTEFTYTNYIEIDESGTNIVGIVNCPDTVRLPEMMRANRICCSSVVYDTARVGKVHMPAIRMRQDWGLWIQLINLGMEPKNVGEQLFRYRVRESGLSGSKLEAISFIWRFYGEILNFGFLRRTWRTIICILIKSLAYYRKRRAVRGRRSRESESELS